MKTTSKRGVYLRQPQDVRRLLSRLINSTVAGATESDTLRAVSYASNILLRAMETSDLEKRLEALEEAIKNSEKNRS